MDNIKLSADLGEIHHHLILSFSEFHMIQDKVTDFLRYCDIHQPNSPINNFSEEFLTLNQMLNKLAEEHFKATALLGDLQRKALAE